MDLVRAGAGELIAEGRIVATQGDKPVEPDAAKGPSRLRAGSADAP